MRNLLLIALASILVSIPVRSATISAVDGVIDCDGITCSGNSTSCTVTLKTFGDCTQYEYNVVCADADGNPTDTLQQILPNPNPGTIIDTISIHGGGSTLTDEQQQQFEEDMINVQNIQNGWAQWADNFNTRMQNMFSGFSFWI